MDVLKRIEDGKVVIYKRGGTYYARIKTGPDDYIHRTLKTGSDDVAIKKAQKLYHEVEFKAEHGLPVRNRKFTDILNEYVTLREKQHEQGSTSAAMITQIRRVSKFWHKFAGKKSVMAIDNAALREYLTWRRDYYSKVKPEEIPANASIVPVDSTLQWELTFGKTVLKWAHEKGYRGNKPLPDYSYVVNHQRVRPAFEISEYQKLTTALITWEMGCSEERFLHTRQLLTDYVTVLANTGMRVGEANNLKIRDVLPFTDGAGRDTYRFIVRGKTGERDVIPYAALADTIKRVLARRKKPKPDDWFFCMKSGSKVINLGDQFDKVLKIADVERSAAGDKFCLYSLRHFYAVQAIRNGIGVFDIARNMGTSVEIIQAYYAKQATPMLLAEKLGGKVTDELI